MHADLRHIGSNLFALLLFGFILERIVGTEKFIKIFFITGIVASIGASFFYTAALGASGAVYGILGSLTMIRPKMTVWAFGIPMPMFVAAAMWFLLDFGGLFNPSNVANAAHIAGLISGALISYRYREKPENKENKEKNDDTVSNEEFNEWEKKYM